MVYCLVFQYPNAGLILVFIYQKSWSPGGVDLTILWTLGLELSSREMQS